MFTIKKGVNVRRYNMIVPSISIGNSPQLSIDLILNTLKPKYVGFCIHGDLIPVVGPNAFNSCKSTITTCCEMFLHAPKRLLFLQIRGALVPGRERHFTKDILKWAVENEIQNIICLVSVLATVRKDKDLVGCQFRYLLPPQLQRDLTNKFKKFGWTEYEDPRLPELKVGWDPRRPYVPIGGWCQLLYYLGNKDKMMHTLLVMSYAYEGDNTKEAIEMADAVNMWIKLIPNVHWIKPISWCGVNGDPPPPNLY